MVQIHIYMRSQEDSDDNSLLNFLERLLISVRCGKETKKTGQYQIYINKLALTQSLDSD